MKNKTSIIVAIALLLTACTSVPGARPTSYNYPPSYLESYPLNKYTEEEAITKLGPPDQVVEVAGKRRLVYLLRKGATLTYSYIIENGIVTDVIYNESGSLNGQTAKELQAAKGK